MASVCPICNSNIDEMAGVCPTCGYHMLDATKSFTPVKMGGSRIVEEPPVPVSERYELKVVRGPQTGIDIALHEGTLSLGRDPRCDVFLNDMTVSRMHAVLEVRDDGCLLSDNNSFNGVWVNDRSIETCLLKPGDLIQIGAFCLQYRERV